MSLSQHFYDTLSTYLQMLKRDKIDCSVLCVCGENVTFVSLFCYSLNTHTKMKNDKEVVRLRQKAVSEGRKSLYLDIYVKGTRRYEFLRLYLLPDTSRANKEKNRETMRLANAVKAKRIVEIQNGRFGFSQSGGDITLFTAFEKMLEERKKNGSPGSIRIWKGALLQIKAFERRKNILLTEITPTWLNALKTHLKSVKSGVTGKTLSKNTQNAYFAKVVSVLNKAERDGLITNNPAKAVKSVGNEESERMWLTIDEVRKLSQTPCSNASVRRAFLFSCLTGLRRSDVLKLRWADVEDSESGCLLRFRQQKTKEQEYMYISEQARQLLGERNEKGGELFRLPTGWHTNNVISQWVKDAGIDKHITFHCARHTFATMMLTLGTDLYTTSKLLGHRSISTTQIYARIVDKKKREAVERIPDIL